MADEQRRIAINKSKPTILQSCHRLAFAAEVVAALNEERRLGGKGKEEDGRWQRRKGESGGDREDG